MDIRFLDETEDMENTLKKEILNVLNKHSQSKRGWGWTIMEDNIMDKEVYYILFYSPEREEVDSIKVVTDDDDYDFTGKDKDELLERLKDDIETKLYGVYSKDWFYHGFCDDTLIATFKSYDDAKVFADNTDKDVYIVKIFVEDGYDDTTD